MSPELFKYFTLALYVALTFWLSWIGLKKTRSIAGFSIGNRDMSPYLVGITLAASIASTATFVINPGFVYTHGLSAYLHFGIAASAGILTAFIVLSRRFLRVGSAHAAITIPDWIYHRYQSRPLSLFFAFINLLSIAFVVLILVGCSLLLSSIFPISQQLSLVLVLFFVFSYVLMGGTYAHAYTNTLQGFLMIFIASVLFVGGLKYFDGGFLQSLRGVGENFARVYNPDSDLYYSFFSVFVSGFVITFALMLQPHILTKVLYLKNERDVGKFILTTVFVGLIFSQMLLLGFYARLAGVDAPSQDAVLVTYLLHEYNGTLVGQYFIAFVFVALLAAGMSTLDGILVALSAMVVNDIYQPLRGSTDGAQGLKASRIVLVIVGCIAGIVAWNPPELVGLFAQKGVYGLGAASLVPILFGTLSSRRFDTRWIFASAVTGLLTHLVLNLFMGVSNPAVSATWAIFLSLFVGAGAWISSEKR